MCFFFFLFLAQILTHASRSRNRWNAIALTPKRQYQKGKNNTMESTLSLIHSLIHSVALILTSLSVSVYKHVFMFSSTDFNLSFKCKLVNVTATTKTKNQTNLICTAYYLCPNILQAITFFVLMNVCEERNEMKMFRSEMCRVNISKITSHTIVNKFLKIPTNSVIFKSDDEFFRSSIYFPNNFRLFFWRVLFK